MKILHIITSLKLGGGETMLYRFLAQSTKDKRYQHVVAYFHPGPFVQAIKNLGIPVVQISGVLSCYDPLALWRLRKFIKQCRPDVIHSSLWSANVIARLFASWYNIPLICDLHGNAAHEGSMRNLLDRLTVALPKKIVAVADGVKKGYEKTIVSFLRNPQARACVAASLTVIKNGIDTKMLYADAYKEPLKRADFGLQENDFVIGSVGRLDPIKSYNVLVGAFFLALRKASGEGRPLKLMLVGGGQDEGKIKKLVERLGITNQVVLVGARNDGARFYRLFDCFALSSQSEGLSIALLEAMAFGLPIVSTCVGRHEVLVEGENGLLVPVNNELPLAQALLHVYQNPAHAQAMGLANKDLVKKTYTLDAMIARYHELYDEVMQVR
ncbi:glycosyltransferase [Candidatus Babeliales bacterium]|nr:glycosyltransferase [Candidatus Babeliales bacterium]